MRRSFLWLALAAIGFVVLLIVAPSAAAAGWRLAFVTAGAPFAGAVLMLLVARVVGARWDWFGPLAGAAPVLAVAAIGIGLVQLAAPAPPHLGLWQQPIAVGIRAVIAAAALAWAGARVLRGASATFAAIALAVYAVVSTAIGSDWLIGGSPGHAVSAIGMILFAEELGAACAVVLVLGWGDVRFRRDMGMLLIAAGLGLSYMFFMDFLILWYGDLPAKIGWYVDRATPLYDLIVALALILGLLVPIAAQALRNEARGQRIAGMSALVALVLIDLWWVEADLLAVLAAICAGGLMVAAGVLLGDRRHVHG